MTHRWPGTAADSAHQASARNSRAAKRFINNIPQLVLSDTDEEFIECDSSFSHLNLDGAGSTDMAPTADELRAIELAKPFDEQNMADDDEAWKKEIRIKFDLTDIEYTFNSVEDKMRSYGINLQWSKKAALVSILPEFSCKMGKLPLNVNNDTVKSSIQELLAEF